MKQGNLNPGLGGAIRIDCRLEQNESDEWLLYIGKTGNPLPASIVEIALWLKIKELEEALLKQDKR